MTEPPFDRALRLATCLSISGGTTGEIHEVSHSQFAGKIPELRPAGGKEPAQPSSFAKLLHSIGPQARSTPQSLKNAGQLGRNRGLSLAEQPPCKIHEQIIVSQRKSFKHACPRRVEAAPIFDRAKPQRFLEPTAGSRASHASILGRSQVGRAALRLDVFRPLMNRCERTRFGRRLDTGRDRVEVDINACC